MELLWQLVAAKTVATIFVVKMVVTPSVEIWTILLTASPPTRILDWSRGEIERIKQDVEEGCLKSTARRYGIDVSRLRELAQADREGRIEIIEPDVMECIKTIRKAQAMLRSE